MKGEDGVAGEGRVVGVPLRIAKPLSIVMQ